MPVASWSLTPRRTVLCGSAASIWGRRGVRQGLAAGAWRARGGEECEVWAPLCGLLRLLDLFAMVRACHQGGLELRGGGVELLGPVALLADCGSAYGRGARGSRFRLARAAA